MYDEELKKIIDNKMIVGYARRSSTDNEDKQFRSIDGQIQDVESILGKYNLKYLKWIIEKRSAFKRGRPEFNELIKLVEDGKIKVVFTYHANRLARNYEDGGRFTQLISDGFLIAVITPYTVYKNTPMDKAHLMEEFTRATRDSDDKSEAVKRGYRIKLKEGYIPAGRLPEGYIHVRDDIGKMINEVDPDRFPKLQQAVSLVVNQSYTPTEALDYLNLELGYTTRKTRRMGGRPMAKSTWYKILSNPIYKADLSQYGGSESASYPALMSDDDFNKIQVILGKSPVRRKSKHVRPYQGLITCKKCNSAVVIEEKWQIRCTNCKHKFHKAHNRKNCPKCSTLIEKMISPKIYHYQWLTCGRGKAKNGICSQRALAVQDFETQIDKVLESFDIPKEFTKWALEVLREKNHLEVEERSSQYDQLQNRYNAIQKQIDALLDLRIGGEIDQDEYTLKKKSLLDQKQRIKTTMYNTDSRADEWLELTEKTFNFATQARYWFKHGTPEQKRVILATIGSNMVLDNKNILIQERKPFLVLKETNNQILKDSIKLEQLKMTGISIDNNTITIHFPNWLPGKDSNLECLIQSQV